MKMMISLIAVVSLVQALPSGGLLAAEHGAGGGEGPAPKEVYGELMSGNERFIQGKNSNENESPSRRRDLTKGQKPRAIILTCADSRVPPEVIFDKGLGEIFVVRVAGNILGVASVASIEYAVEHLGSKLIVVMGHDSCGAVQAALGAPAGGNTGSFDLDGLVMSIQGHLHGISRDLASSDPTLRKASVANVDGVAVDLLNRSKIVREAVEKGHVAIVRALYGLESGKVDFWGQTWH